MTRFLNKFKAISFDTLKISSPGQTNSKDEFVGIPLDSVDAFLFPKEIAKAHLRDFPGLFACYKFPVTEDKLGLIVRTSAMYVPSSIKLFIYDLKSQRLIESLELADNWGDAGDSMIKTSWLLKDKNSMKAFLWINEGHDNSVEHPSDSTTTLLDKYYLIGIYPKSDTLCSDSLSLATKFKQLLPKYDLDSEH